MKDKNKEKQKGHVPSNKDGCCGGMGKEMKIQKPNTLQPKKGFEKKK